MSNPDFIVTYLATRAGTQRAIVTKAGVGARGADLGVDMVSYM